MKPYDPSRRWTKVFIDDGQVSMIEGTHQSHIDSWVRSAGELISVYGPDFVLLDTRERSLLGRRVIVALPLE